MLQEISQHGISWYYEDNWIIGVAGHSKLALTLSLQVIISAVQALAAGLVTVPISTPLHDGSA